MKKYLKLLFGLGLLVLLFYWVPLQKVIASLGRSDLGLVTLAFGLSALGILVSSLKLKLILSALGTPVGFPGVLRAYYVGTFFNNFIPTSVGGDLVKVLELNQHPGTDPAGNGLTVFLERLTGITVLVALAGGFVVYRPDWYRIVGLSFLRDGRLWLIAVLVLTGIVLLLNYLLDEANGSGSSWMNRLRDGIRFPLDKPITSTVVVLLSGVFHGLRALTFLVIAASLGFNLEFSVVLFVLPIIAFASFLPISMGGIGLREGIITFCLYSFGLPLEVSLSLSLLIRLFSIVHSLAGGVVYLRNPGPVPTSKLGE